MANAAFENPNKKQIILNNFQHKMNKLGTLGTMQKCNKTRK